MLLKRRLTQTTEEDHEHTAQVHARSLVRQPPAPPFPGSPQHKGPSPIRRKALDHVVVIMFENRSFDNLLGRLYEPGEVTSFEGVIGKDLSNPIPEWAEDGGDTKVVPYGVARNDEHAAVGSGRGIQQR